MALNRTLGFEISLGVFEVDNIYETSNRFNKLSKTKGPCSLPEKDKDPIPFHYYVCLETEEDHFTKEEMAKALFSFKIKALGEIDALLLKFSKECGCELTSEEFREFYKKIKWLPSNLRDLKKGHK